MTQSFEEYVTRARYSEQTERYEDMAEYMKQATEILGSKSFKSDERNLLSVAYKNVVGSKRSAWRIISSLEAKAENVKDKPLIEELRNKIEDELKATCKEVLSLIEDHLLKNDKETESESLIFYLKMKGDYYRYLAEIAKDNDNDDSRDKAKEAYNKANTTAIESLKSTSPIRLGLALNFSVFYYEIMNQPDKACSLAKKAFDDAITDLDSLNEDSYKDSTLIMQLLRDNLTLWTASENQEDEKEQD